MERAAVVLSRLLVVAGAIGLFGSLFLPWLEIEVRTLDRPGAILPAPNPNYTAWEAFRIADVQLALIAAAAAFGVGLAALLRARWPYLGIALLGWLATAITVASVYRPAGAPALGDGSSLRLGFALGLLSAGVIAISALWAGLAPQRSADAGA
jgi:hypothetical protein